MSAQHTPGPWRLHPTDDTMVIGVNGRDEIAEMRGYYSTQPDVMEANARLIAAAPDMLAVCEALLDIIYNSQGVAGWHRNGDVATWDEFEAVAELEAAIAKAKPPTESPGASST